MRAPAGHCTVAVDPALPVAVTGVGGFPVTSNLRLYGANHTSEAAAVVAYTDIPS